MSAMGIVTMAITRNRNVDRRRHITWHVTGSGCVTRTGVNSETDDRGMHINHPGRSRHVNDLRSAFNVNDLRWRVHDLRSGIVIHRRRHGNHWRLGNNRSARDRIVRLAVYGLSIHRLTVPGALIHWGLVSDFRGCQGGTNERPCRSSDHRALRPAIAIMPTNQAAGDSANDRTTAHRGPEDLLRMGGRNTRQRDRDRYEDGFHSTAQTQANNALFK
jgi:hypothetical protein